MTNLLAAILTTVVTNVTEAPVATGQHAIQCPDYKPGQSFSCTVYHSAYDYDGTKKNITTTIKRVTTCKFDWLGKPREIVEEEILSQKTMIMEKVSDWKISAVQPPPPSDPGPLSAFIPFITNSISIGSLELHKN